MNTLPSVADPAFAFQAEVALKMAAKWASDLKESGDSAAMSRDARKIAEIAANTGNSPEHIADCLARGLAAWNLMESPRHVHSHGLSSILAGLSPCICSRAGDLANEFTRAARAILAKRRAASEADADRRRAEALQAEISAEAERARVKARREAKKAERIQDAGTSGLPLFAAA